MVKVMFTPLVKDTYERYVLGYIGAYVLTKSGVDICTAVYLMKTYMVPRQDDYRNRILD